MISNELKAKISFFGCIAMLFIAAYFAGFSGVMTVLWLILAGICWIAGFAKEEGVRYDNFLFRYMVAEGAKNGLTKGRVYTRIQLVSGVFLVIIPAFWYWST